VDPTGEMMMTRRARPSNAISADDYY